MYEIRWFFEGELPPEFQQFLNTSFNLEKEHIDYYLPASDLARGEKIRGELHEIKERISRKQLSGTKFVGFCEEWIKSVAHVSELPDGLIEVSKKRWKTLFSFYDDILEPTSIPSQMSINVECSLIQVHGKTHHSICIESVMSVSLVTRAIDEFLSQHSPGINLTSENSMGYPEFLMGLM